MGLFLSISSECNSAAVDIINCELGDHITPAKSIKKRIHITYKYSPVPYDKRKRV